MKKLALSAAIGLCAVGPVLAGAAEALRFNPDQSKVESLTMPDGTQVFYKAYEGIFYVTNIEDSTYQTLNIYVPLDRKGRTDEQTPILMRNNVGGYMASPAGTPSVADATGPALAEGFVLCIPGARGNGASVTKNGKTIATGTAPNGLLDLKAATRYLHYNDDLIPGNSELIFTDGTSAGGAMSALQGITGNATEYEPYLKAMGAAGASDAVFASICYCPITDLNHADMEYEWLYGCTNTGVRHLNSAQVTVSDQLAALCPDYINSLDLKDTKGNQITSENYMDYLKTFIIASAQRALEEGCEIPDSIGIIRYQKPKPSFAQRLGSAPVNGGMPPVMEGGAPRGAEYTDYVTDVDWQKYLTYVATATPLKTPPAFDAYGVLGASATPENRVFGDSEGNPSNFTEYSLRKRTGDDRAVLSPELQQRIFLMNPMYFISDNVRAGAAKHWYIRHGAKDRDTSFLVPVNFATKLRNAGYDVNFFLPWNRPHSGDYNLNDLFNWIKTTITQNGQINKPQQEKGGKPGGPQLGTPGGGPVIDKSGDATLQAMIKAEVPQFEQFEYNDAASGKTIKYNLFTPKSLDKSKKYPLVLFMADASTPGTDVTRPLTQGYGALVWATDEWQKEHPCYVLVPQYSGVAVNDAYEHTDEVDMVARLVKKFSQNTTIDSDRLYTTGQSMGGMISMYYNSAYPDLFAASIFVDCHWDSATFPELVKHKFAFITAGKAGTFGALEEAADKAGVKYEYIEFSARLPQEQQNKLAAAELAKGAPINIINFESKTVLPESGEGSEHMYSFDHAYKLTPVREWLFLQRKR